MTRAEAMMVPSERRSRSIRHRVRSCLDRVAAMVGLLGWCERWMRRGLTILMYHRVLPADQCASYPLQSLAIPAAVFREQMRWLAGHCRVMPVRDALAVLERGGPSARPLVAVTFDDGYADNYDIAAEILEEHELRGTFFVTSGFVEQGEPMWFDRAADAWTRLLDSDRCDLLDQLIHEHGGNGKRHGREEGIKIWMEQLKRVNPALRLTLIQEAQERAWGEMSPHRYRSMTPAQVAELHHRGHEIASHTVTHPILPQLNEKECQRELEDSRTHIGQWIGDEVTGLCYPNGDFDHRVEAAVRRAGYQYACTTVAGLNRREVVTTQLSRVAITTQRTMRGGGDHDELGFRSELSQLRSVWR